MLRFSLMLGMFLAAACCQTYAQTTAASAPKVPYLTAQGTIMQVDEEMGIVTVNVDGKAEVFFLSGQSKLFQPTQHMSTIELEQNDPVTIQYVVSEGENKVVNLIDRRPEILKS